MKDQLMYSLENCDALLRQLKDPNNTRINHIERSNYIDFEYIDYLIQDFRKREFGSESSPFMRDLAELKAFKENYETCDLKILLEYVENNK